MLDKHVVIFKNVTSGFMNLECINYLADIISRNDELRNKIVFILENDISNESNQAIMQMYNSLVGFDIFKAAFSENNFLRYCHLNELQLRRKVNSEQMSLDDYLKSEFSNNKIKIHIIENNIYENVLPIVKEIL